jgi:hypothetical protein
MLARILAHVRRAGRPPCLAELSRDLDIEAGALQGMLDTLVLRGRLRVIDPEAVGCGGCPTRGGCVILALGLAKRYAVAGSLADGHPARSSDQSGPVTGLLDPA